MGHLGSLQTPLKGMELLEVSLKHNGVRAGFQAAW
jgi:hypothetical protein